jgi:hypothetical protein
MIRSPWQRLAALTAVAAVGAWSALPALAQTSRPAADAPWQVTVMPYLWASGMSGKVRPFTGAPTLSLNKSFSDILEDLDFAFFLSFAAERDRLVVLGDVSRVVTSRDGLLPGGVPAEGRTKQTTLTLAGGQRVLAEPTRAVDVFAGLRAVRLEADVKVLGGALSASPTRSFVDPLIGARGLLALSPVWSASLYADVGGFGLGSDLSAVGFALLNYRWNDRVTLSGGWRGMHLDYDDKGTLADVTISGPMFSVAWQL